MKDYHSIIKRPVLTEKSTALKSEGNIIIFEVAKNANKKEIKSTLEKLFKVHVEAVNTSIVRGKKRRMGRFEGKQPNWKKAVVRIREGEKIELFEGV